MVKAGEWLLSDEPVEINVGRRTIKLKVRNTGDRPVQIGSHYHFFEVNRALEFDRPQAMGMHLNIAGGLAIRIEPGDEREVELVEYGGKKRVMGFNNLVDGGLTAHWTVKEALERARTLEFKGMEKLDSEEAGVIQQQAIEDQGKHPSKEQGDRSSGDQGQHGNQDKGKDQGKKGGQT